MYALIQMRSQLHAPRPHHRGQQHPERAVHDRQLRHRRGIMLGAGFHRARSFGHRHCQRGGGAYIFRHLLPEYLLRFVAWVMSRFIYRFKVRVTSIPSTGAAIWHATM